MHPAMSTSSENPSLAIHLTEEEALIHEFDNVSICPEPHSKSFCLVVKILTPKTIKPDWICNAMKDVRITRLAFLVSKYQSGLFMVCFGCEGHRRRVDEGQPLHFDRSLMLFAIPDGFDIILPIQLRFLQHCDTYAYPPSLSYKDTLRAPPKTCYKKSIFELSNSIPFEEQPSLANTSSQGLQDAPLFSPIATNPTMITTITTATSKGKGPVFPEPAKAPSVVFSTPRASTTTRTRSTTKRTLRSMLKRARSSNSDFAVVPSMFDFNEQAGVTRQPCPEK
uniref:Uncharacterized protein n=1 Tax=Cannabis sativa TaxID=3483 RepID=A0A803Q6A8_CANSA